MLSAPTIRESVALPRLLTINIESSVTPGWVSRRSAVRIRKDGTGAAVGSHSVSDTPESPKPSRSPDSVPLG